MIYDTIIIGKGPAGISASIYLARAGLSVLVLGNGIGALERAEKIENYYGFPEPLTGLDLFDRGIVQAKRFGVLIQDEEVVKIGMEDTFIVGTMDGEYSTKTILLATGKSRFSLKVPGFEELRGRGVSFCATCDGFFYRNKRLAVLGSGAYASSELHELLTFTKDITVFTDGKPVTESTFPANIPVITEKITGFLGSEDLSGGKRLCAITTADGVTHSLDGVFVALGTAGAADFAAKMGVEVNGSDIVVNHEYMTNIDGLFAAGDCIGGFLQVSKAVSDGSLAAKSIIAFCRSHP